MTRATYDEVAGRISALLGLPPERIGPETPLFELPVDSFLMIEMIVDLQEEFDSVFGQAELARISTIGDLVGLLTGEVAVGAAQPGRAEGS